MQVQQLLCNLTVGGVEVCTDLSGKEELQKQVVLVRIVTSGNLGGVMVSTLTRNVRGMHSILTLGIPFPIFAIPMRLVP